MSKSQSHGLGVYIFLFIWAFVRFGGGEIKIKRKRERERGRKRGKREGKLSSTLSVEEAKSFSSEPFWKMKSADSEPCRFLDKVKNKIKNDKVIIVMQVKN